MAAVSAGRTWATGSTVTTAQNVAVFKSDAYAASHNGTSNGPPFRAVNFDVSSASAVPLQVSISALGIVKYPIPVGTSKEFICIGSGPGHIATGDLIVLDGEGGTATFSGGITA